MAIRLLIVDDAPFIREVVKDMATSEGIEVVAEATTGNDAIEMALSKNPDVILMDLVMPDKNGLEACKEILEVDPHMRIIAFSTLNDSDLMMKSLDAGCVDFLQKPFTKATLMKSILSVMQLRGAEAVS